MYASMSSRRIAAGRRGQSGSRQEFDELAAGLQVADDGPWRTVHSPEAPLPGREQLRELSYTGHTSSRCHGPNHLLYQRCAREPKGCSQANPQVTALILALVAQRIEHLTTDQKVGGSSPSERATLVQVSE